MIPTNLTAINCQAIAEGYFNRAQRAEHIKAHVLAFHQYRMMWYWLFQKEFVNE